MSTVSRYTLYHPRWYRRRMSVWWWLHTRPYATFVLRELTSVFVALFAGVTLWQLRAVTQGPEAYVTLEARLSSPLLVSIHVLALVAILFHTFTWFGLTPKAMVMRLRGRRVPDRVVVGLNFVVWIVVSAVITALLLRG